MGHFLKTLTMVATLALIATTAAASDPTVVSDSLMRNLMRAENDSTKVAALVEISKHIVNQNANAALDYAQQALALAEKMGDEHSMFVALENISQVTFFIGLNDLSAEYMSRLLDKAIADQDQLLIGRYYFNIGTLKHIIGDLSEAEQYVKKGWAIIDSVYTSNGQAYPKDELATIYNNIAYIKWSMDELAESEHYYSEGLRVGSPEEITWKNYSNLNVGMANVRIKQKRYDSALQIIKNVQEIISRDNDLATLLITYRMEADIYNELNDNDQALAKFMQALQLANSTGTTYLQEYVAEGLYNLYNQMGLADSSLKYLQLYQLLNDQNTAEKARQELIRNELMREYQEREAALNQKNESNQIFYRVVVAFAFLMAGFFSWLFFRTRTKYDQAELQRLEAELKADRKDLEASLLRTEVERKDKELATQVMYTIQKNEMITDLVEKLQKKTHESVPPGQDDMRKIIRDLEKTTDKHIWEEFETRFEKVHTGFYESLNNQYPSLTVNERRLCAFLRLDMTTKEIATLTGQTVRAVEMARIRLRKKLDLTNSDRSLYDILSTV